MAPIIARRGRYNLCWCGDDADCFSTSHFVSFAGSGLTTDDRIMPLANCGTGVAIYGFPQDGMATTKNGRVFTWGPERVMADVATYQLCWCQGNCEHAAQFQYTIGTITLGGPLTNQMHLCYELQNCNVSHLSGWGLRKGDRLIVGDGDCREGVSIREGFPADGISFGSQDGHFYHWAPVTCRE